MLRFLILLSICAMFVIAQIGPCVNNPSGRCPPNFVCEERSNLCYPINSNTRTTRRHMGPGQGVPWPMPNWPRPNGNPDWTRNVY